jgi:hypothetical protein
MKNFILSLSMAGLSTIAFVSSAAAAPIGAAGNVESVCGIGSVQPSVLGANSATPDRLSSQYTGGSPAAVTVLCNTSTSRVTITPNVSASVIPAGGFIEYQLLSTSGSTGIYAGLNTPSFPQPQVPSYTTPVAGDTTAQGGDILRIHTDVVAPSGVLLTAGTYRTVLDVTLAP